MRFLDRGGRVPADVLTRADLPRGEKVLAHTLARDGTWLLGTRLRLVVVEEERAVQIPWETVEDAAWNQDAARLRFTETGQYGEPRPTYSFEVEDPALLLQLLRERVTASVVLQRGFLVSGKRGFKVIGRRSPDGGPISWMHEYDAGIDPDEPGVAAAAAEALAQARSDVGEEPGAD